MFEAIISLLLIFTGAPTALPEVRSETVAMSLTFDQLMGAIAGQESGGMTEAQRYAVVNAYGAVGKYQVLKGNVPEWSRAALGYSISWQQFRDSPALQEKIVRHRMKGYFDKYGDRGAASAWYSGNPKLHMSTNPQPGGPSIKSYVDSVIARGLKLPAGGGGSTPTPAPPTAKEAEKKTSAELAEEYGFVTSLLNANPELKKLFDQAVKGQWTGTKFQAAVKETKWFKTHSESERQWLVTSFGDPATAKQKMTEAWTQIRQLANKMGIEETPTNYKKFSEWAYKIVALNWDEGQLRNEIGKYVYSGGGKWQGEGAEINGELREYAYSMGVTMAESWYVANVRAVVRGIASINDYKDVIRRQAKSLYTQWGKQIDGGQSVMDIASPYMQSMTRILEVPPGSVNLFDPTIKRALQNKDQQTGANAVKPLWEFENQLRNDERWKKTKNAQDSMMQVAHQVLSDFGMTY